MTYESSIKSRYINWQKGRITQGDILESINFSIGFESEGRLIMENHSLKYAVVMSQDCDLESHDRAERDGKTIDRAILNGILICPAYPFEQFILGTHIEGKELGVLPGKKETKSNDKMKRYHFLQGDINLGVTDLILDFKDFFTVPYDIVSLAKKTSYVTTVNELYRENLSQRFAAYLSRIGLPELDRDM